MIGTRRNGGAAVAETDSDAAADAAPAKPKKAGPTLPVTRLVLPTMVLCLGLAGEFLLPNHLTYAASTALCYGLVGLGLYLPLAALRELPLNGGAPARPAPPLFPLPPPRRAGGQRAPRAG